jgi:hypothetical protein
MENKAICTEGFWGELDTRIMEDFARLEGPERVFFYEIMKGLAGGTKPESMLIHQPNEYKKIMGSTNYGDVLNAAPLMRYIAAKYDSWGEASITLAMAYRAGIADGKRLDRARRAHK